MQTGMKWVVGRSCTPMRCIDSLCPRYLRVVRRQETICVSQLAVCDVSKKNFVPPRLDQPSHKTLCVCFVQSFTRIDARAKEQKLSHVRPTDVDARGPATSIARAIQARASCLAKRVARTRPRAHRQLVLGQFVQMGRYSDRWGESGEYRRGETTRLHLVLRSTVQRLESSVHRVCGTGPGRGQ